MSFKTGSHHVIDKAVVALEEAVENHIDTQQQLYLAEAVIAQNDMFNASDDAMDTARQSLVNAGINDIRAAYEHDKSELFLNIAVALQNNGKLG